MMTAGGAAGMSSGDEGRTPPGQADCDLGLTLSSISHEIRNPLASLKLNAQMIARAIAQGRAPRDESGRLLMQSVEQLDQIAAALSETAAIDSGRITLTILPLDVVALARISAAEAEAMWRRPIALESRSGSVVALGDAARVSEVIARLLANAAAHTPDGRAITLAVRQTPGRARIEARDEGVGIAPADLPRIFEPFYRGTSAPPLDQPARLGLGLGLTIARGLVWRQGGEIGVDSTLGQGATAWFTLPLAPRN